MDPAKITFYQSTRFPPLSNVFIVPSRDVDVFRKKRSELSFDNTKAKPILLWNDEAGIVILFKALFFPCLCIFGMAVHGPLSFRFPSFCLYSQHLPFFATA